MTIENHMSFHHLIVTGSKPYSLFHSVISGKETSLIWMESHTPYLPEQI